MKCLIVLSLVALAHAATIPLDTPEVAAVKAAHLAEVQRAAAAVGVPYYPYVGYSSYAVPVVTPEGFIADTPEVAAAKTIHFAEKARAAAAAAAPAYPYYGYPYAYSAYPYYSGPIAIPVVTPEGYLADTPEVAAAKAAHFAEVAKAEALA